MYQSGLRIDHSTDLCLAQLKDFVSTDMDKKMQTGMTLVALKKAFDTFNHGVLLQKMKYFSFRTSLIKWFESYLSSRRFSVCIGNVFSKSGTLKYGIPQGSTLGPLIFFIICKWSSPIIIRCRLLFLCSWRWHLYLLPTWGR